jgi:hypothetical protein
MHIDWKSRGVHENVPKYVGDSEYYEGDQPKAWIFRESARDYMSHGTKPFVALLQARKNPHDRAEFDTFEEADEWVFLQLIDIRMNGE